MRILLTGVGCPGVMGTLDALRDNPARDTVYILGVDLNPDAVGKYRCDSFRTVPAPEDTNYLRVLRQLCTENKIELIIPQTTREIAILSEYRQLFECINVRVMVNAPDMIDMFNNKHTVLNIFEKHNLPCAGYHLTTNAQDLIALVYKMGYPETPVVVKPLVGNGGRGIRVLSQRPTFSEFISSKPDGFRTLLEDFVEIVSTARGWPQILVMEYLPGDEYTVDVLNVPGARVIIPRIRHKIRSGISFDTEIVDAPGIVRQINVILNVYPLLGAFGFQFKDSENGVPCILECNPRIQGTMAAAKFAGVNIIWAAAEYFCYGSVKTPLPGTIKKTRLLRYWGAITQTEGEIEII